MGYSLSSLLFMASGLVFGINWLILSRDEFRNRTGYLHECIRNQLRQGGTMAIVVLAIVYLWLRPFQSIIVLVAAFWLLGLMLKAFSNEGKIAKSGSPQPPPVPNGGNAVETPASPQNRPAPVRPNPRPVFVGAIPRGPEPPIPVYPESSSWGKRIMYAFLMLIGFGIASSMFFVTNVRQKRVFDGPEGFTLVSGDDSWNFQMDEVFRKEKSNQARIPQVQQSQSQSKATSERSRSTRRNRNSKESPSESASNAKPPVAQPAPVSPASPPDKPAPIATQPPKSVREPNKIQINVNEIVGDRLASVPADSAVTIYGESDSGPREALNDVYQRVAEGIVHYLRVEYPGLNFGDWKPKPNLIERIKMYSKSEEQPMIGDGKSVYRARVDLLLSTKLRSQVYQQFLADRAPTKAMFLGQLYAGLVLMTGGLGVLLRLGTSKRVPQTTPGAMA